MTNSVDPDQTPQNNSVDPDQRRVLRRLIWVYTVCSGLSGPILRIVTVYNDRFYTVRFVSSIKSLSHCHLRIPCIFNGDGNLIVDIVFMFLCQCFYNVSYTRTMSIRAVGAYGPDQPTSSCSLIRSFNAPYRINGYQRMYRCVQLTVHICNGDTFLIAWLVCQ